ncbi:hypothetical protein PpBr36_02296, partial [Pyricularia pennisetigena]|uniref:hypothetical protein n=1 Tax=Pyricularia pennisetigena TaxID=1578925 RepID=UPI00114E3A7A
LRFKSPLCVIPPIRIKYNIPNVFITGSQNPRLETNGQTDCISTNETLKAVFGFKFKENEDENAAVKEWYY